MSEEQEPEVGADPEPLREREPVTTILLSGAKSRWHKTRLAAWTRRRSVRQIRQYLIKEQDRPRPGEDRENADTRLPDDESVQIAGLVLVEAFPPSIVTTLQEQLKDWSAGDRDRKTGALNMLIRSRTGLGGGSTLLGMIRPTNDFSMPGDSYDIDLPAGVDAVYLRLHCKTSSLAMVSATFLLDDDTGDLSSILRSDRRPVTGMTLEVRGRFGKLRSRIPWSRPKDVNAYYSIGTVDGAKAEACEAHMQAIGTDCHNWLAKHFSGRFSQLGASRRPIARVMLTDKMVPFRSRELDWRPAVLGTALETWRSSGEAGWALNILWNQTTNQNVMTFAARRPDVAVEHVAPGTEQSNWSIMQRFDDGHLDLVSTYSLVPLLSLYGERVSRLRDTAGRKRLIRRPVKEAAALDGYLLRDGLDAVAVSRDIRLLTENVKRFQWNLAAYVEDMEEYPARIKEQRDPIEFLPAFRESLHELASRLPEDAEAMTANIRASADLRQAISNTRLQRAAVLLAVVAIVISVWVALHPPH